MCNRYLLAAAALLPGTAFAAVQYHEVPVLDVEPIVETVATMEPRQECWFERVPVRTVHASASTPLIGALIGGAVGNAVGHKKRNKQVGAVVGALIGGSIGYDIQREARRSHGVRQVRRQTCAVVETTRPARRVTGYRVTYRYAGETYRTRMATHPGDTIRVRVRVTPVPA